ncbi:hypothetical protein DFQ11_10594 [Winogradskyella epiphytica]|uniref:Secreted protein n=1 Tax=Winogradskyella epiphytica TaxID=262005 RepID=A0A2V4YBQ2_9FLAO|nr:hypothetical protein [Winogradskyella epiphytica]PYE80497.1 hypothetical protein DFQ11_10594 [Winogradskyella epiphytica]GGW69039.1 hypothetical protein GCM10008085_21200 [Winogradskyella epiphytica]
MSKKIIFTIVILSVSLSAIAQKSINNYKYVIVPESFNFTNGEDQYQLSSLTKFLFNKANFQAYFADEMPEDLKKDRCLALTSDVNKVKGGMFKTKLEITLKDCYGAVVLTSKIGESRIKDYGKAYHEALRDAFKSLEDLNYNYVPAEKEEPVKEDKVKEETVVFETPTESSQTDIILDKDQDLYYAQAITNGFQIVDSEPKVIMILLKTSAPDTFIVKDKNAIVFKKGNQWIYSENDGSSTSEKVLTIKF